MPPADGAAEPAPAPPPLTGATLHHAILTDLAEHGVAPTCAALAERFAVEEAAMASALEDLAEDHGVVLHPHAPEVWIAHPFATAPTPFVVRRGEAMWWATCAWCAMGVVALVAREGEEVTVTTTLGAEGEQVVLRVTDGVLADDGFVVHFPVPMERAWDNVVHTCSVMLLFRDREEVDGWCARHRITRGDVQPVEVVRAFAADWYGRHLDQDWRKWTTEEATAIFARHGLDHEVWALPTTGDRF